MSPVCWLWSRRAAASFAWPCRFKATAIPSRPSRARATGSSPESFRYCRNSSSGASRMNSSNSSMSCSSTVFLGLGVIVFQSCDQFFEPAGEAAVGGPERLVAHAELLANLGLRKTLKPQLQDLAALLVLDGELGPEQRQHGLGLCFLLLLKMKLFGSRRRLSQRLQHAAGRLVAARGLQIRFRDQAGSASQLPRFIKSNAPHRLGQKLNDINAKLGPLSARPLDRCLHGPFHKPLRLHLPRQFPIPG